MDYVNDRYLSELTKNIDNNQFRFTLFRIKYDYCVYCYLKLLTFRFNNNIVEMLATFFVQ